MPSLHLPSALALAFLVTALLAPRGALAASFRVETNALRIKEPASYAGSYDSAIGDFGVPLYGGTLQGRIGHLAANPKGCSNFTGSLPEGVEILLAIRGDCFFVEKAYHAQLAGAKAVIVADNIQEHLLTMAIPEDRPDIAALVPKIAIPVALVQKDAGDRIQSALAADQGAVIVEFDWKESIVHPDNRVEWELWFSTNTACGQACSATSSFLAQFKDSAVSLEQEGFTAFTPHVMLGSCSVWTSEELCHRNCIRGGKYCSTTASSTGAAGELTGRADLRHLCVHKVLNETKKAWQWWEYAARFAAHCRPEAGQFTTACSEQQLRDLGVDTNAVGGCVGSLDSGEAHPLLDAQVRAQNERGPMGRVIMLPTLVVNTNQYRGRLNNAGVLRALCAGFAEGTEPPACLNPGVNVDECTQGVDTCWKENGFSACVDTFRGYVCHCPEGWIGDGYHCTDIDECATELHNCEQVCINTPGSFRCECNKGYKLLGGSPGVPGVCIPIPGATGLPVWLILVLTAAAVVSTSVAGITVYRWRTQHAMQDEIRAIM
ncbi:Vacuolar-sorting receptor 1 [Auxenochlorella protothecoides]|uniref:Vacuolar-sorting receptor 1 n=2 Tax=Auxenochlorella protothecoides TaxID=3075 RepID=A0A087SSJ9_AUXPR|nr:Vacuolar-sorting receptor 1 [Auxenochlorella protothecoides]KFM28703.1 Vacuolar-sorting receptor 1 [Auxenochlorella protothecoides]